MSTPVNPHPLDVDALTTLIRELAAATLEVDPASLSATERFRDQGLDSVASTMLAVKLEGALGRHIPVTAVWQHPTIAGLARYLADGTIEGLEEAQSGEEDESRPGPWDGLLAEEPGEPLPPPPDWDEPDEDYEPLPGFEQYTVRP